MNILITNDDGIRADGIIELAKTVATIANVYVIAPETQKSATGHAITIHNPIMVNEEFIQENIKAYSISGTPADCVKVGIEALLKDVKIDLVLSGINNGPNLGEDVIYSGTVSAAIEGFIQKKPSIAFSYDEFNVSKEVYLKAADYAVELVNNMKDKLHLLDDCVLNVNIPNKEVKGYKITKLGTREYENDVIERVNPHGKKYLWIGGRMKETKQEEDSDVKAVNDGYISITPVNIDMTCRKKIDILKNEKLL
ncbi:5'/3'-nucleotidase SurE [Romboutsia maritimum]|uniref:5'-nucleotidase SurE n=1 Tax=Romboutsia maritimum TaxID=2020948 RepID=A0A371ITX2_9FIRM|nr:5'/3'-nucleotidase SurE [Romboutsia maritimum]RDY23926.1 5'/3'-nucleotidase SurE [Romboutsia maritimum]